MTEIVHADVLDAALQFIIDNADREILCDGAPASYAEATDPPGSGGKALADAAVSGGDFSIGAGDTDGRKLSCVAKSGVPIDDSGDADHLAIVDDAGERVMLVLERPSATSVAAGGPTATIEAWSYTFRDPA
jgi:hypothetical protein